MANRWWESRPARLIAPGMVFALALVVAGCGGDDDEGAGTTTTETTTTAETTTTTVRTTTSESTSTEPTGATVAVYFSGEDASDCSAVEAYTRNIADDVDPIEAAFDELVAGPTAEEAADGAGSFFSSATADVVSSLTERDGLLIIDFTDLRSLIPNASTSCGSEALLAQLNNTAFQFPTVDRVRYQFEGSCQDFGEFIQTGSCEFDR